MTDTQTTLEPLVRQMERDLLAHMRRSNESWLLIFWGNRTHIFWDATLFPRVARWEERWARRRYWLPWWRTRIQETWSVLRHGIPECDEWHG